MWKGGNTTQRGYGHAWRKIRKRVIQRDKHLCQSCLSQGRYTQGNEVDHIKPKAHGGTDDMDNLQTLCHPCHKAKTSGKRDTSCTAEGIPTDTNHHWNRGGGGEKSRSIAT
jgi:5-methylcytosine-specific restriction protein A